MGSSVFNFGLSSYFASAISVSIHFFAEIWLSILGSALINLVFGNMTAPMFSSVSVTKVSAILF